jgi:hypothetical protein
MATTNMMNRRLFEGFAADVSVDYAVAVARACDVSAEKINAWLDGLTHHLAEPEYPLWTDNRNIVRR